MVDLYNPDLGLVAHWALDESQPGSTAIESSGLGSHGTPSANPPTPTTDVPPVRFGNPHGLAFNAEDPCEDLGNPGISNLGGPISLAAWIRPIVLDDCRDVVAQGHRWEPSYALALRIYSGTAAVKRPSVLAFLGKCAECGAPSARKEWASGRKLAMLWVCAPCASS
jgi:hypothetical protein